MRTKVNVSIENMYSSYPKKIDKKTFKLILYTLNKLIAKYILNGDTVALPHSLGGIAIRKDKMQFTKLHFDYSEYNKTGIKSFFLNGHSGEFYSYPYWNKKACRVKNKVAYRFDLTRENKRALAKIMKQNNGHHRFEVR